MRCPLQGKKGQRSRYYFHEPVVKTAVTNAEVSTPSEAASVPAAVLLSDVVLNVAVVVVDCTDVVAAAVAALLRLANTSKVVVAAAHMSDHRYP